MPFDNYQGLAKSMGSSAAAAQGLPAGDVRAAGVGARSDYHRLLARYLERLRMQQQQEQMAGLGKLIRLFTVLRGSQAQPGPGAGASPFYQPEDQQMPGNDVPDYQYAQGLVEHPGASAVDVPDYRYASYNPYNPYRMG